MVFCDRHGITTTQFVSIFHSDFITHPNETYRELYWAEFDEFSEMVIEVQDKLEKLLDAGRII